MRVSSKYIIPFYFFFILFIVGLYQRCSVPEEKIVTETEKEQLLPINRPISENDLQLFMLTVEKYQQDTDDKLSKKPLSYGIASSTSENNKDLAEWVAEKGWNPQRFFYIEGRLAVIISAILKDRDIRAKQKLMKESVSGSAEAPLVEAMNEAVAVQDKKLNVEKISNQERALVEPNLEKIATLLQIELY